MRVPGARRLYALDGVGTLELHGMLMRSATASAPREPGASPGARCGDDSCRRRTPGAEIGSFRPREIRRGGTVHWYGREYTLRPHGLLRERYVLADHARELVVIEATGWWGWGARRPVRLVLEHAAATEPGLLLFASFIVRTLADGAAADAGGSAAVVSASSGT